VHSPPFALFVGDVQFSPVDTIGAFFKADGFDIGCSGVEEEDRSFCFFAVFEVVEPGVLFVINGVSVEVEIFLFVVGCWGFLVCHQVFLLYVDYYHSRGVYRHSTYR